MLARTGVQCGVELFLTQHVVVRCCSLTQPAHTLLRTQTTTTLRYLAELGWAGLNAMQSVLILQQQGALTWIAGLAATFYYVL
jgi:hypothetical protein